MENPFRKVIQISSSDYQITALCNDGTLWGIGESGVWRKIKDIPNE